MKCYHYCRINSLVLSYKSTLYAKYSYYSVSYIPVYPSTFISSDTSKRLRYLGDGVYDVLVIILYRHQALALQHS